MFMARSYSMVRIQVGIPADMLCEKAHLTFLFDNDQIQSAFSSLAEGLPIIINRCKQTLQAYASVKKRLYILKYSSL